MAEDRLTSYLNKNTKKEVEVEDMDNETAEKPYAENVPYENAEEQYAGDLNTYDKDVTKAAIGKIVGIMFASRTWAHRAHLKTPHFSKHKALDSFYNGIVDLADELAEAAQGKYRCLEIAHEPSSEDITKPIAGLEAQLEKILAQKAKVKDGYLENILQEIEAFYYKHIYLLKELI